MTQIINLTPHSISILVDSDTTLTIPASGQVARVDTINLDQGSLDWDGKQIPLQSSVSGPISGLPPQTPGVWLLVSLAVRAAAPDRKDLLSPGPLVRNDQGQPIGCKGLTCNV